MAFYRNYVQPGMRVVGSDGNDVGEVLRLQPDGFVVRHPPGGAVSVPYDTIQNVMGNEIVLNVPASQLGT